MNQNRLHFCALVNYHNKYSAIYATNMIDYTYENL